MTSVEASEESQVPVTASAKVAAIALGMSSLALLNSRGAFAATIVVAMLATLFSPGRAETIRCFQRAILTSMVLVAAAVVVVWLPSTALSYLPWESLQVQVRMVLFLVLGAWVYAYFSGRPRALDLLLKALFAGLAFGLLATNIGISAFPEIMVVVKGQIASTRDQAGLMVKGFASAAVVLVPLVLWAGWRLGELWRTVSVAIAVGLLILVVLASSRAGMAGLIGALGIVLVACLTHSKSRRWAAGIALIFVVTVAGILGYLSDYGRGSSVPEEVLILPTWLVDPHRQLIWQYAMHLADLHPWFGWGINTINLVPVPPGMSPMEFGVPVLPSHPHNWIIEIFAETGMVGGIPMLIAVAAQFVAMVRSYQAGGELHVLAALAASAAFWVSCLSNFSFWSAWWQVSYILVLALLYAGRPAEAERETLPRRSGSSALSATP